MILHRLYKLMTGTLRRRLVLGAAAVNAVTLAFLIGDLTVHQRAMLLDRQIEEATALSHALATSAAGWITADDISGLQELVDAQNRYPELLFTILADREGRVLAATDRSKQGQYLLDLPREARQTVLSRTPALIDVAVPSMIGGRHVGWARVGIGQKDAVEKLTKITRDSIGYALAAVFISSIIAWLMGRWVSRRLYAVQKTINAVRSGNHHARTSLAGTDEASVLAHEFNSMLDTLAARDAELHSSEKKYRNIFDESFDGLFIVSAAGKILDINRKGVAIFGYSSKDEIQAMNFSRDIYANPADRQWILDQTNAHGSAEFEVEVKKKSGEHIFTHWALTVVKDQMDQPVSYRGIVRDVTERKRAEEALHRLNRELRAISNCNQTLMRAEDEQALLNDICLIVCKEAGYRMAWVGFAENDDAKTIRPVAHAGVVDGYLEQAGFTWADTERGRGPSGTAIRSGESTCIQDFSADPQAAPWRDSALQRGYRSSISLPLKDENRKILGVLNIYSAEINGFTPDEIRLLEELAGDLAFGIAALRARIERREAEKALRQSEESYRQLFARASVGIILLSSDGKIFSVNEMYARQLGYSPAEMIGMRPEDFDTPASARLFSDRYRRLQAGETLIFEVENRHKAGHIVPLEVCASRITIDGNHYFQAFVRDITGRKQAEEAIKKAGEYNRSLIEASLDPLVTIGSDGKISDVNAATETVTGYSRKELIGTDFSNYFTEPEKASAGYQQVFHDGLVRDYPLEIRHRNGKVTSVLYNASVYRNEEGQVLGVFAAARDITERKQGEKTMRLLSSIVEFSDDAIIGKTLDGVITSWNSGAEKIYGYRSSEVIGKPISVIIPDDRKTEEPQFYETIRRGDHIEHFETVRKRKDGRYINVSLTISPMKDAEGRVTGASTIARDITERKRAEAEIRKLNEVLEQRVNERTAELARANARLMELDHLKSMFIASMSHELRTPLNSIIGFSSILLNEWVGPVSAEQKENLASILRSGKHLLSLINDVIDVTKVEAGKLEPVTDDVDLYDVVMEALTNVEKDIQDKNLDLKVQVEHCLLHTDRRRLFQCILNILSNAVKFTERGSIIVTAAFDGNRTNAEIVVSDTGIGMREEDIGKLFAPFVRIDSSLRIKAPGTGLGLYLTRKLLTEVLHGDISVSSVYGKGSRFTIRVPAVI